jgi:molybdopterin converting factor small subunit
MSRDGERTSTTEPCVCSVRVFGSLRPALEAQGRPYEFTAEVPAEGIVARELAQALGLDLPRVEGVFVNHLVHGLGIRIMPGDEIGFVPNDIPGPHRYYLGLYAAGKDDNA